MPELTDLSTIRALCEKYDFSLSKGYGQNFIINPGVCPKIVDGSGIDGRWGVIEIGPGIGVLTKELAEFHFTDSAAHIHNWVRGMNPWPAAWFVTSGGKKVKVMESRLAESAGETPGIVLATKPLTVACGSGAIQLLRVVPEGSKPMEGSAFAAGLRLKAGDQL